MAGSNKTNMANLLRTVYQRYLTRQFPLKSLTLQMMEPRIVKLAVGAGLSIAIHAAGGAGYVWNSAGVLPDPTVDTPTRAEIKYKQMSLTVEFSADLIDDAKSDTAAETDPVAWQIKSALAVMRRDLNYDLLNGDGSGQVGVIVSAAANAVVLDDLRGVRNNMKIDVLLKATGSVGAGGVKNATVSTNRADKKFSLVGVTFADGDGTELNTNKADYGVYRAGSYNDAIWGFAAAISASNPPTGVDKYGLIDRSVDANDYWRAIEHTAGSDRRITPKLIVDVLEDVEANSDAGDPTFCLVSAANFNVLIEDLITQRRYGGRQMKINGWADAVEINGVPVVKEHQMPDDRAYIITKDSWALFQNDGGKWMDKDGAMFDRVDGKTAYKAAWYRRMQPFCRSPISNGVLLNLDPTIAA